jgi:AraC-like DNA-binding protein
MLWFDCTSSAHHPELHRRCAGFFNIASNRRLDQANEEIGQLRPKVLCFDFDYPDQERLRAMQTIKREHARLPILMLTVEHSEALAVWAFRARVWNYLVKPVPAAELDENLQTLTHITRAERRFARAVPFPAPVLPEQLPSIAPEDPHALLRPAIYYIEQHFNEKISADAIASLCGLTRFRFSRLFHGAFGTTFQSYVMRHRIASACQQLRRPSASITEVGYAVGFNDASYFARMFKRYVGMLPSEYASGDSHPRPSGAQPILTPSQTEPPAANGARLERNPDSADEILADIA